MTGDNATFVVWNGTCEHRCSFISPYDGGIKGVKALGDALCYCDQECKHRGDCCPNYEEHCEVSTARTAPPEINI